MIRYDSGGPEAQTANVLDSSGLSNEGLPVRYIALTCSILISQSCSCNVTGREGHPDTDTDGEEDTTMRDPLVPDGPCGPCDDGNACTMDFCNSETLACVFLPMDLDFDGQVASECGGDDCDDSRGDVFTGAPEVCVDGVDQDCDTVIDGPVFMGSDIQLSASLGATGEHSMVWMDSGYAIEWVEKREGEVTGGVILTLLDPVGIKIGDDLLLTSEYEGTYPHPSLGWNGSNLAALWGNHSTHEYRVISPVGEEISSRSFSPGGRNAITWTGSVYGIAYTTGDSRGADLLFMSMNDDGEPVREAILIATEVDAWNDPALAWSGTEFVLVWEESAYPPAVSDLHLGRLDTHGEVTGPSVQLTDTGAWFMPSLAWTGSEIGLVMNSIVPAVFFRRMDPGGTTYGYDLAIVPYGTDSYWGDLTWTGSEYGISWVAGGRTDRDIAFSLLDSSGTIRYQPLMRAEHRSFKINTSLVWTGSEFGVAWADARDDEDCRGDHYSPDDCSFDLFFNRIGLCE